MRIATFVVALALSASTVAAAQEQTAYEPGGGIINPELIRKVEPKYTDQAKARKIAGEVWLDCVVQADGTVKVLGVKKSLDKTYGLDEAAVEAAKSWLFKPGIKDGKPVAVHVVLIQEFKSQAAAAGGEQDAYQPGKPSKNPVVKSKVDPKYTRGAMQAKIQGEVWIDAIVETDGTIRVATVKKSLDTQYGLDDAALDAAKHWTFTPGTLDGKPVRMHTMLIMEFKLH